VTFSRWATNACCASPRQCRADVRHAELQQLIDDMFETMRHVGGVGLAAPQIGIDLQLVIFGFERSERYPDAEAVPQTILLNPVITPTSSEVEDGWEGCLSVPGLRGVVPRFKHISYEGIDPRATRSTALPTASMRGWCSTSATT
jgi:peptide deformylase